MVKPFDFLDSKRHQLKRQAEEDAEINVSKKREKDLTLMENALHMTSAIPPIIDF